MTYWIFLLIWNSKVYPYYSSTPPSFQHVHHLQQNITFSFLHCFLKHTPRSWHEVDIVLCRARFCILLHLSSPLFLTKKLAYLRHKPCSVHRPSEAFTSIHLSFPTHSKDPSLLCSFLSTLLSSPPIPLHLS